MGYEQLNGHLDGDDRADGSINADDNDSGNTVLYAGSDDHNGDGSREVSPLLGNGYPAAKYNTSNTIEVQPLEFAPPTGTVLSSCVNLANTILGAGTLAIPSALASVGLIPGVIFVFLFASASAFGLHLLAACANQIGRTSSYYGCARITYPKYAFMVDFAVALKCLGVGSSYLIVIGNLMPKAMIGFGVEEGSFLTERFFWISIFMSILIPISFFRRLDALKFTSLVALTCLLYLMILVIYYFVKEDSPRADDITLFNASLSFPAKLGVFVFAFTCHQNIFSIHNELIDNTIFRVDQVIGSSVVVSLSIYLMIGLLGYLSYGANVKGNLLLSYPNGDAIVQFGFIALTVLVCLSYPLQGHPFRNSVEKMVIVLRGNNEYAFQRYIVVTVFFIVVTYGIAISGINLDLALSFIGSTASATICYILPGMLYYKLSEGEGWNPTRVGAVILAGAGAVLMVISVAFIIIEQIGNL